jgi:cellulose synthase/poly-beta-1,6-N-acetylglucosamine synthase-like glycosyltransferase
MSTVTAIVSAYYAEEFLRGRLVNLKAQSLEPEIVVVCQDGSEEHAIAREFEVKTVLTTVIPTVYDAWNMAIRDSEGDYITSANSDDRFYPGALEKMAAALDRHSDRCLAYANVDRVTEIDGESVAVFDWAEGGLEKLLEGCFIGPMPMWRRSLHEEHGYFFSDYTVAGDYEFWMRLALAGERFYKMRCGALGAHLEHDKALEHREGLRATWETAKVRGIYRDAIKERKKNG